MPFYPAVQYRGDMHLARGISGLGAGLGRGIEQRKQLNDTAKGMDTIMKANPEFLGQIGIDEETWKGFSSREKVAAGKGLFEGMAMQQQAAKQKAVLGQIQAQTDATNAAMMRDQLGTAQLGNIFAGLNEQPRNVTVPFGARGGLSQVQVKQNTPSLLASNPYGAQQLPAGALNTILGGGQPEATQMQFVDDPVTGQRFAIHGKSVHPVDQPSAKQITPSERLRALELRGEKQKELDALAGTSAENITPTVHRRIKTLGEDIKAIDAMLVNEPAAVRKQGQEQLKGVSNERVRVVSPNGQEGYIPASQLEAALKQGYKRAGGN